MRAIHDAPFILERFTYGKERYVAYLKAALMNHVQKDYWRQVTHQGIGKAGVSPDHIQRALDGLVLSAEILEHLGVTVEYLLGRNYDDGQGPLTACRPRTSWSRSWIIAASTNCLPASPRKTGTGPATAIL